MIKNWIEWLVFAPLPDSRMAAISYRENLESPRIIFPNFPTAENTAYRCRVAEEDVKDPSGALRKGYTARMAPLDEDEKPPRIVTSVSLHLSR